MDTIRVEIRTADMTRKAQVEAPSSQTGADIIQAAITNWQLPSTGDYQLVNATNGTSVSPRATLAAANVREGDILELQPVLLAG